MTMSRAQAQVSLGPDGVRFPLYPVRMRGVRSEDGRYQYPLEIVYDYTGIDSSAFVSEGTSPAFSRWAQFLPPLDASLSMAEGDTPLIDVSAIAGHGAVRVYVKDESRNPTGSHKDRLNFCTVSAARITGANGVIAASTGNHGVSTAAYAARAGLKCVIFVPEKVSTGYYAAVRAYGAYPVPVAADKRWEVMGRFVDEFGFAPTSNLTTFHTGHPFGPEGYKTIAYEILSDLGRAPTAIIFPTGYAELLYGVVKGFQELLDFKLIPSLPRAYSVEPAVMAPLASSIESGMPMCSVAPATTRQSSIAVTVNGYRGVLGLTRSGGRALKVTDAAALAAQESYSRVGLWYELSSASALAATSTVAADLGEGEVVVIATSCGSKDPTGYQSTGEVCTSLDDVLDYLHRDYGYKPSAGAISGS